MRDDVKNELEKYQQEELGLLNKSEISRRMGCSRKTVKKYIDGEGDKKVPNVREKKIN